MKYDRINEELKIIFQRIIYNNFTKKEFNNLINIIKTFIVKDINLHPNLKNDTDSINDLISQIIENITKQLLKYRNKHKPQGGIINPSGYLRTIIRNELYKFNVSREKRHLRKVLNNVLIKMENDEIIDSYNNRRLICLKGIKKNTNSSAELYNYNYNYGFKDILRFNRYTENFQIALVKFIEDLLGEVGCINFSSLYKIIEEKMLLNNITESIDKIYDDESIDKYLDIQDINQINLENAIIKNEFKQEYKNLITNFYSSNKERNGKILFAIFLRYCDKSYKEIADILGISSPTTIYNWLNNHEELNPLNFIQVRKDKLISNDISDSFINSIMDDCLEVIWEIIKENDLMNKFINEE